MITKQKSPGLTSTLPFSMGEPFSRFQKNVQLLGSNHQTLDIQQVDAFLFLDSITKRKAPKVSARSEVVSVVKKISAWWFQVGWFHPIIFL